MTDKLREAAQLALEALSSASSVVIGEHGPEDELSKECESAISALRAALAQQDAQKKHKPLFAEMIAQHTELSEPENRLLDTLNELTAELQETRTALAKMVQCSKTMNLHQCADASQHAEAVLAKRPYLAPPEGDVVVTFNESMTRILFVTRQDEEGRIIKVIAEAPAQQDAHAVPQGYALVPLTMNQAMEDVVADEGWQWYDLLAAAGAITDVQYSGLTVGELAQQDAQAVPPKVWPDVKLPKPELLVWRGGKLHGAGFSAKQVRKCAKDYALAMLNARPQPQQDAQAVPHLKKLLHAMHQEINAKHNLNEWLRASPAFAQRAAQAEAEWVVAVKHLVAVQMEAQKYVQESAALRAASAGSGARSVRGG